MKKLIALLMVICIMACGCGKEETKSPEPAPATSTPTPVEKNADDGFTTADEYTDISKDIAVYEELYQWVCIAVTDSSIPPEDFKNLNSTIRIDNEGLAFKDTPDSIASALLNAISFDIDYYRTSQDYYIGLQFTGEGFKITKDKAPGKEE